ncbi:hypothetical protein B0I35DRAFT_407799 [Stachybotrys elegans]|uniref:Infection structure specific protein n=1 Tax=Stachybotrys elegans TaxID=80388 RepID=A0A8K0WTN2_9HYPO|nr:hypothetical protein B0I35DRAFT_407799 [Stachybotrys elegans]
MRSFLLFTSLLGVASTSVAEIITLGAVPTGLHPAPIEARQDLQCASSVLTELLPPTPDSSDLVDWEVETQQDPAACTVTAPASLSSAYTSWMSQITEWAQSVEDEAASQTDCGAELFTLSFSGFCSSSRTVYFSEAAQQTTTEVYGPVPLPTNTVRIGAASKNTGLISSGIALACVVAAVLAL